MAETSRVARRRIQPIGTILWVILVGILMGVLAVISMGIETKWVIVMVVAVIAPSVVLLVGDFRKLILVVLVADMALLVDIAIRNQGSHSGGPTGYLLSMSSIVIVIGYALWIMERQPVTSFFPIITVPALFYLGMVVLSLYQSFNLELSLFGVFLEVQLFLIYFYLANHVRTWDDLRLIMTVVTIVLLAESVLMLLQLAFGFSIDIGFIRSETVDTAAGVGGRVAGTLGSPNSAAAYLSAMLVLVLASLANGKLINTRLGVVTFLAGLMALIGTMTRTAWGSFAIAFLILLPLLMRVRMGRRVLPVIILISLSAGVIFYEPILQRLKAVETDTTRQELAYMAYNIINAHPLGIGQNNYDQVMSDRFAHPNMVGHTLYVVHNKYLLVWAETGLQGLIAFALFLLFTMWQAGRILFRKGLALEYTVIAAGLLGALVGYAYHMTTEGFASRVNLQILWFMVALVAAYGPIVETQIAQEASTAPDTIGAE